jgi:hypothetical protein
MWIQSVEMHQAPQYQINICRDEMLCIAWSIEQISCHVTQLLGHIWLNRWIRATNDLKSLQIREPPDRMRLYSCGFDLS